MPSPSPRRARGRPAGGGNTADQAKELLLDAAERLILLRGYQASTMELIAQEAGYSRALIYRQFPNRRRLLEALVQRVTKRHHTAILERLPVDSTLTELFVEALVIVATELIHDPLLKTISEQTDDGTVAHMIAGDPQLPVLVATMIEGYSGLVRPGLAASDVAKFVVSTALSMLLGVIPGIDTPDVARRYLRTFVLPAILIDPPNAELVFTPPDPPVRRRRVGSAE
ncbi:MAG: TetR/AcrR family transcriptional regulator [Mycobacterium sp.]